MSSHVIDDLKSSILDFQANEVRIAFRKKTEPVDPFTNPAHTNALRDIWMGSKLEDAFPGDDEEFLMSVGYGMGVGIGVGAEEGETGPLRWRRLGFESEDLAQEFAEVGVLGLECLVSWPKFVCFEGFVLLIAIGICFSLCSARLCRTMWTISRRSVCSSSLMTGFSIVI